MSEQNPVRKLNAETARKIAAGEVIDRPNAVVRELMDNAIDSGAKQITVEIAGGGIEKIRVVDNGCGMTREDLATAAHPHCTSKIADDTDLLNLSTLGFRGEALASIAAVARLSIISSGYKMRASITEDHIIEPVSETPGTIVTAEGLFENFPARRQFLKRPASESVMCRQTFIEKSLPRPDLAFRFVQDGEMKIDLQASESQTSRFVRALSFRENEKLFYEIKSHSGKSGFWGIPSTLSPAQKKEPEMEASEKTGGVAKENEQKSETYRPNWNFTVVLGEPSVNRTNKKDIYIFVNGRRIQEYSLVQAVEYGGQGYFPNGTYPVAAVFIQINPKLVDFNIHPAKKEARFSDISELHHALSTAVRNFYKNHTIQNLAANALDDAPKPVQRELAGFSAKAIPPIGQRPIGIGRGYTIPSHESPLSEVADSSADFGIGRKPQASQSISHQKLSYFSEEKTARQSPDSTLPSSPLNTAANTAFAFPKNLQSPESGNADDELAYNGNETEARFENSHWNPTAKSDFKFLGSALGTFLVAEKNGSLFIIDQHAAHERILFNKIMAEKPVKVPLIIPYELKTESASDDEYLETIKAKMDEAGFEITNAENGGWEVNTTPDRWKGTESDLRESILSKKVAPTDIIRSIAAMTACKAAVKDHYILDDITAGKIAEEALTLPDPHCPHGRPIYHELSREKLFALVKRT